MEKKKIVAIGMFLIIILLTTSQTNAIILKKKKDDYPSCWNDMNSLEIAKDIQKRINKKPWETIIDPEIVPLKIPKNYGSRPLIFEPPWDFFESGNEKDGGGIGMAWAEQYVDENKGYAHTETNSGPGIGGHTALSWISHGFWFQAPVNDFYEFNYKYRIHGLAIGNSYDNILPPGAGFSGVQIYIDFETKDCEKREIVVNQQTVPYVLSSFKEYPDKTISKKIDSNWFESESARVDAVAVVKSTTSGVSFASANAKGYIEQQSNPGFGELIEISVNWPNHSPLKPDKPIGPNEGSINSEYEFSTIGEDPDQIGDSLWYKWNWGDGLTSNWLGPYAPGESVIAKHSWKEKGNYLIKVKTKDTFDEESSWSQSNTINIIGNRPPDKPIIIGPSSAIFGLEYTYKISSTDPENDNIGYLINWGDGQSHDDGVSTPYESGEEAEFSILWSNVGTYTIQVQAKDKNGGLSEWTNMAVNVPKNKQKNIALISLIHELKIYKLLNQRFFNL